MESLCTPETNIIAISTIRKLKKIKGTTEWLSTRTLRRGYPQRARQEAEDGALATGAGSYDPLLLGPPPQLQPRPAPVGSVKALKSPRNGDYECILQTLTCVEDPSRPLRKFGANSGGRGSAPQARGSQRAGSIPVS